jgi:hypothetical protein
MASQEGLFFLELVCIIILLVFSKLLLIRKCTSYQL